MAFFAVPATASAATYLVETGGADVGDCTVAPCATIDYAIAQHRGSPQPDDVIEVAAGTYEQNVDATDPADDGLTIRGELDPGGDPATEITGDGGGAAGCFSCIVALGASPSAAVEMQNVLVTQTTADPDITPVFLTGGSDLTTVDVNVQDAGTFAGVELCSDPGSVFDDVVIDAVGTDASGIDGCAAVTIVDSAVFTDDSPALTVGGDPEETTEITRSWMSAADGAPSPTLFLTSGLVLDSSLVTGGFAGVFYGGDPPGGAEIDVNNSTIDAGDPEVDDAISIFVGRFGVDDPTDVTIESSILVDAILVDNGTNPTTLTCAYTNFTSGPFTPGDAEFTDDCPPAGPGSTNTNTDPADLFEDALFGDWSLRNGSPAIDAGQPGAVPAGFSATDIDGDPRRVAGTAATCPEGERDQGAFEAPAVSCAPEQRTLTVSTAGTGTGTVTGPGIDCGGAAHTDCSETVTQGTAIELTATPAEGSRFDGFTGSGCAASPCTVTLDSSRAVEARFNDAGVQALRVELTGEGRGTVTGPGIDCGESAGHGDCTETYPTGEQVTLTATPEKASQFNAFSGGGCSASPCTVTMSEPRDVAAAFDLTTAPTTTFAKRPQRPWPAEPVFKLRSSAAGSTFECKVDREEWSECGNRVKLRNLDPGKHKLRARATDAAGVTGPPATDRFRIPR